MNNKAAVIYQYTILIAIIFFLAWGFAVTKEWNDTLLGALIGVMVMVPITATKRITKEEKL